MDQTASVGLAQVPPDSARLHTCCLPIGIPGVSMTLEKWVNDPIVLGNDQPFFKGRKETPGRITQPLSQKDSKKAWRRGESLGPDLRKHS